jgi:hypothetical protein
LARELIDKINQAGGDVLLLIGDTAGADGNDLEECLSLFNFPGPRLFVAGNHELWTRSDDSYRIFKQDLPRRVRALGWQWLQDDPFISGPVGIVGSIGWYDYSFAPEHLQVPRRFYQHKIAPGSASRTEGYEFLFQDQPAPPPTALDIFARWNDGRHVKLHRDDERFVDELAVQLDVQLTGMPSLSQVVVAMHHLPFHELLPPHRSNQWDFARTFLGSDRLGQVLEKYPNVKHLLCGHTHLADERTIGHIQAVNVGAGYRWKTWRTLDLPD